MRARPLILIAAAAIATIAGGITPILGQQPPRQGAGRLQLEPLGNKNEAVFPYFEGWYNNEDGTATIMLGYYNRNTEQTIDVPIGPNNRMEPGGPDRGQPTTFLPRRQYGVFSITVPKDFGNQKITWTLTANNLTNAVTVWLNPKYFVEPFKNIANGNTPAQMRFGMTGPVLQGPPKGIAQSLQAAVNQPLPLEVWAADLPATYDAVTNRYMSLEEVAAKQAKDAEEREAGRGGRGGRGAAGTGARETRGGNADAPVAIINGQVIGAAGSTAGSAASTRAGAGVPPGPPSDVTIVWSKYRGPGDVTFEKQRVPVELKGKFTEFQKAVTTATFSAPGEYVLRAVANDSSGDGGGGDQCCWSTAHVKVTVK
jgi:hypothetical protein